MKLNPKKFNFKSLEVSQLNLLCEWMQKPHILTWWNDHLTPEEIKQKYGNRLDHLTVCPYIAYLQDKPIGFIQYYWASKVGDGWWPNEDHNTVGLDQFIGEEEYVNKGYGTTMIKEFVPFLFENPNIKKIITEADPNNYRAQRCYKKVGFIEEGVVDTPDGRSILFTLIKMSP